MKFHVKPKVVNTTIHSSDLGIRPPVINSYTAEVVEGLIENKSEFAINTNGEKPQQKIVVNIYSIVGNDVNNLKLEERRVIEDYEFTQLGMTDAQVKQLYIDLQYGTVAKQTAVVNLLLTSFGLELA
jgi:ribosomal protein L23